MSAITTLLLLLYSAGPIGVWCKHKSTRALFHLKKRRGGLPKRGYLKDWRNVIPSVAPATPTPTNAPTTTPPTLPPTSFPTLDPHASDTTTIVCEPTSGTCVNEAGTLVDALATAENDSVVAICDASTITMMENGIGITASNVTLCCEGDECRIELGYTNVIVTGDSFTLFNVDFFLTAGFNQGHRPQLAITGNGTHLIEASGFYNGKNMVFVNTLGHVIIRSSLFVNGTGALRIENAETVHVESSEFRDLSLGLETAYVPPRNLETEGQILRIRDSAFVNNAGTGILSSNLGVLPKLSIMETEFTGNGDAPYFGVAGTFCCPESYGEIILSGNYGTNQPMANHDVCDGFFFWTCPIDEGEFRFGSEGTCCLAVDEEIDGSLV